MTLLTFGCLLAGRIIYPTAVVLAARGGFVTIKHMLLPRFTLRSVLWGVAACAVVAFVAGQAVAGQTWALASLLALGGAVIFFAIYALSYVLVRMMPLDTNPNRTAAKAAAVSGATQSGSEAPPRSLA